MKSTKHRGRFCKLASQLSLPQYSRRHRRYCYAASDHLRSPRQLEDVALTRGRTRMRRDVRSEEAQRRPVEGGAAAVGSWGSITVIYDTAALGWPARLENFFVHAWRRSVLRAARAGHATHGRSASRAPPKNNGTCLTHHLLHVYPVATTDDSSPHRVLVFASSSASFRSALPATWRQWGTRVENMGTAWGIAAGVRNHSEGHGDSCLS